MIGVAAAISRLTAHYPGVDLQARLLRFDPPGVSGTALARTLLVERLSVGSLALGEIHDPVRQLVGRRKAPVLELERIALGDLLEVHAHPVLAVGIACNVWR
jgi:hypothetical protein